MKTFEEELRPKLVDMYIDIARGFYFEGSDEITERNEFAPAFADRVVQLLIAAHQAEMDRVVKHIIGNNETSFKRSRPKYRRADNDILYDMAQNGQRKKFDYKWRNSNFSLSEEERNELRNEMRARYKAIKEKQ